MQINDAIFVAKRTLIYFFSLHFKWHDNDDGDDKKCTKLKAL